MEVPAHEVKLPMWIESQRMRNLIIDKIGVETQRGVVKEERKMSYDNRPYGTWNEKSNKLLFQGGSYAWTPIGSAQHIDSAAIPEFQEFYDRFYQPNNATLVISGDIDTKQIRGFIDTYFGSIPRGKDIVREKFILEPYNGTSRETIEDPKAQLPAMFVSYRGPKMGDVDAYAFQMLNDILASGESSRLYQRLVDKDQVAVQASAFNWDLQYAGRISMIGVAAPGNELSVVEKTMDEEIKRLQAEGVTDEEFVKAKNIAEVRFLYDKKGALDKGMALAKAHTYFGNANLANTEIEKFYKVTKEDLKRVANKYLTLNDRVVLYYVPKAKTDAKSGG
jgi:predicted Zn-dependent peptidase